MKETANFKLNDWEKGDRIMMEDFNRDNRTLDGALAKQRDELVALGAAMVLKGNCEVYTTSYVGASGNPTLTFSRPPLLVAVNGGGGMGICVRKGDMYTFFSDATCCCSSTWSNGGKTLSWSYPSDDRQLNTSGKTYQVTALAAVN